MKVDGQAPNIIYRREGNLFLVDKHSKGLAEKAFAMQQSLGCQVQWWSMSNIKTHYPLYDPGKFVGGTFGRMDGYFDPYAVLMGYKAKARELGAVYIENEVAEVLTSGSRITGVRLASGESLSAGIVVNCAGAWAAGVARTAGVIIPVKPVKRQVFALDPAVKPEKPLPLTVLPPQLDLSIFGAERILENKPLSESGLV